MRLTATTVRTLTFKEGLVMKLDAKTIVALDLAGKRDAIFFDEELHGFGLRLRASGDRVLRSWVAQYRAGGRTRRRLPDRTLPSLRDRSHAGA
jgi:hypothetical protein